MESIQKPITVAREDFIAELTFMINESGLPPIILEPIFKDMLRDISAVLQKQVAADRKVMKKLFPNSRQRKLPNKQ